MNPKNRRKSFQTSTHFSHLSKSLNASSFLLVSAFAVAHPNFSSLNVQQISYLKFCFCVTLQMPAKYFSSLVQTQNLFSFFILFSSARCAVQPAAEIAAAAHNKKKEAFTRWLMFHENKLLSIYFNKTSTAKLNAAFARRIFLALSTAFKRHFDCVIKRTVFLRKVIKACAICAKDIFRVFPRRKKSDNLHRGAIIMISP